MTAHDQLAATARSLIDTFHYLTLATVDDDGAPRVSPLYFTPHLYADLYWVSRPDARHSLNIARDDRVMAVIFDTRVPVGEAEAVYLTGRAREIGPSELTDRCSVAFSGHGGARVMTAEELSGDAPLRLFVLQIELCEALVRAGHPTLGKGRDMRVRVNIAGP